MADGQQDMDQVMGAIDAFAGRITGQIAGMCNDLKMALGKIAHLEAQLAEKTPAGKQPAE